MLKKMCGFLSTFLDGIPPAAGRRSYYRFKIHRISGQKSGLIKRMNKCDIKEVNMSRRGENIRKRKDGRWEARYMKARDADGKIHYGYLYGKSYKEVRQKRDKILSEHAEAPVYRGQTAAIQQDDSISGVSLKWREHIRYTVKESTFSNYENILNNHILPVLGGISVTKFTNQTISAFVKKELSKGMAYGSVHVILSVLKNLLHYGQELGFQPSEPLRYPRIPASGAGVEIMSIENFRKLDEVLLGSMDSFAFGILLCMYTGIRVGELSGLKWEDVDFRQKKLHIRRTVTRVRRQNTGFPASDAGGPQTQLIIGTPKSATSIRDIPLPDRLLPFAVSLKREGGAFILSGRYKCMEPRTIQRKYSVLLNKCQIPHIKIHALRHQFSCRWIEQGFDAKSLSEILGHASVKTTLDLYVHIQPEVKRNYMNRLSVV